MLTSRTARSFALLLILSSFLVKVSAKCEMTYVDLDNCGIKGSLFDNSGRKIPENEDELTAFCE